MKKRNAAGEKEMRHHMKDVKGARKTLKSEAGHLKSSIGKKITSALAQDAKVLKDMKKADKKK
jgi:hypothetical protein